MAFCRKQEYSRRLDEHEVWGHVGGRIFIYSKIASFIAFIFVELVNLALIFGAVIRMADVNAAGSKVDPGQVAMLHNDLVVMISMGVLLFAGFVLMLFKRPYGALTGTCLPGIALVFQYFNNLSETSIGRFLLSHLLPISILIAAVVIMSVIIIRERKAETRAYDTLTASIYKRHSSEGKVFTESEWEEILRQYSETERDKT